MDNLTVATIVANSLLHTPYRWGGDRPAHGFDCSGLVIEILKSVGVLPFHGDWTSRGLVPQLLSSGATVAVTAQEGDLVFFGSSEDEIYHVGYCLNDKLMVEAGGGDSSTTSAGAAITQDARVRIRPIHSRKGVHIILRPKYE